MEGRCLVKFHPAATAAEKASAHSAVGAAAIEEIPQIGWQIVTLPPGLSVASAVGLYQSRASVLEAEADQIIQAALVPNDPLYYLQWEMGWIDAPEAWDISTGSTGVTIAVLDGGVDYNHPDFGGKVIKGWDFAYDDPDPNDVNGHGTGVAGVAAAVGNNGIGVAGMAWRNPILAVKVLGDNGMGWVSDSAQGIVYAADHGAGVINMSYVGPGLQAEMDACAYAWNKGIVLAAAMGNDGLNYTNYPGGYANVVGVSALGDTGTTLATYSNYGPAVDVAAPGGSYAPDVGGGYGGFAGTSCATPYVSGLAALVFSANPSLTNQQVVDIIQSTADDLGTPGWDEYFGWGRINAGAALAAVGGSPPDTQAPAVTITSPTNGAYVKGTVTVNVTASDNVGVTQVEFYVNGALQATDTLAPYSWNWNTTAWANGSHTLSAKAYDAAGNVGTSSPVAVAVDNALPSVSITYPANGAIVSGAVNVAASASDNMGVQRVEFYLDGAWKFSDSAAPYEWLWDTTQSTNGSHNLVARAIDVAGNLRDSSTVTVTVDNAVPVPTPMVNDTFTGTVSSRNGNAVAWHTFNTSAAGDVTATLSWPNKANLDLYLYDAAGNLLGSSANSTKPEVVRKTGLPAGTYRLKVVAVQGKCNYTLKVNHPA